MARKRVNLRIEIDTPVRELAEGSLLLELSGLLGVLQRARSVFRSPFFVILILRMCIFVGVWLSSSGGQFDHGHRPLGRAS